MVVPVVMQVRAMFVAVVPMLVLVMAVIVIPFVMVIVIMTVLSRPMLMLASHTVESNLPPFKAATCASSCRLSVARPAQEPSPARPAVDKRCRLR
jgi:hypothetical protein